MAKSFVLIMLSVALSFSMIAPTLNSLIDFKSDISILADFSDEEPNKGEKEIYEKGAVLLMYHKFESHCPAQLTIIRGFYKEDASMFDKKVFLPPPECLS